MLRIILFLEFSMYENLALHNLNKVLIAAINVNNSLFDSHIFLRGRKCDFDNQSHLW